MANALIQLHYVVASYMSVHHLVQTAHDNSLVSLYGGQGSDPHLPSTKKNSKPSLSADDPITDLNVVSIQVNWL